MKKSVYPERSRGGFTLVELLVVITIIAILSVIGLTIFTKAQQATRDGKRKADIQAISSALHQYYNKYVKYPDVDTPTYVNTALAVLVTEGFIQSLPKDPLDKDGTVRYDTYEYDNGEGCPGGSDAGSFRVWAWLEGTQGTGACGEAHPTTLYTESGNYIFVLYNQL